jgi:hypothetical protein
MDGSHFRAVERVEHALEGRRIVPPVRCRLMMNRGVNDPPSGRDV